MGRFTRWFPRVVGAVGIGAAVFDQMNYEVLSRSVRTLYAGAEIAAMYKFTEPESLEELSELHTRAANRILEVCFRNEGLYIKLGQGLSSINHVLPPEFTNKLKVLLDNAPVIGFDDVARIVREDTGKGLDELFVAFDEEPIASASIAQVHKARLRLADGSEHDVAVKVQKPNIQHQIWWDLFCHYIICYSIEKLFKIPATWSAQTIEENLLHEIDFQREAENAGLVREIIDSAPEFRGKVHVPRVFSEDKLLTKRVMVTEWIDAEKLVKTEAVEKEFNTRALMQTTMDLFGDMIFKYGVVHCDPHPANVMVRWNPEKPSQQQLVLLDFGLCIRESWRFRQQYAQIFRAIFTHNFDSLKQVAMSWGIAEESTELFASMQLMKPYSASSNQPLHLQKVSKAEVMRFQLEMKEKINKMLKQDELVPRELVFVGRAMNLLRSLNRQYGGPVNRVNIMAERAVASLPYTAGPAKKEAEAMKRDIDSSIVDGTAFHSKMEMWRFKMSLAILAWWHWVSNTYNMALLVCLPVSLRQRWKVQSLEDTLEEREKELGQRLHGHPVQNIATND